MTKKGLKKHSEKYRLLEKNHTKSYFFLYISPLLCVSTASSSQELSNLDSAGASTFESCVAQRSKCLSSVQVYWKTCRDLQTVIISSKSLVSPGLAEPAKALQLQLATAESAQDIANARAFQQALMLPEYCLQVASCRTPNLCIYI